MARTPVEERLEKMREDERKLRERRKALEARVSVERRKAESCGAATPSSRSSATPNPMISSNETTLLAPPVMPSTPSWSPPETICGCLSHG